MAPQVPPRRTRGHQRIPELEKENEAPHNFLPRKPRGILKHSVTAPHASPNSKGEEEEQRRKTATAEEEDCNSEDCRTITLTLSELQDKTQVGHASTRDAKPEASPETSPEKTPLATDEPSEVSGTTCPHAHVHVMQPSRRYSEKQT